MGFFFSSVGEAVAVSTGVKVNVIIAGVEEMDAMAVIEGNSGSGVNVTVLVEVDDDVG